MLQEEINKIMPKIPAIIKAALSAKNREKILELANKGAEMKTEFSDFVNEIIGDAEICAQLVLEIVQDPMKEAGIDFEIKSRDIRRAELEANIKAEIARII